ncbi:MAG: thioredoxin [Betaproteobacteria bacterium RBG_16_56_24]|nr:MAG: thioredoxin [Betaproteobacteria bacterium RBG_16_56_24]
MKIFAAGLLFILCTGTGFAETRDAEKYFFDLKMGDFKSELATAKEEGKTGIMIMFELEDCPFCYRMKHTILNQSEVQDYYHQHFLIFPVDIRGGLPVTDFKGKETTEKAFSVEHRVYGTPVFDFFDLDGKLITRFPGTAKDVNEFLLLGRCVVEGACKTMSFTAYKKQQVK